LTRRHAEPAGFCGRGRGRWSLGTNPGGPRLTRVCRCTRPGAAGARVRSPARTDTYHTATTQHNSNNTPNPWGRRTDAAAGAARRDHPAGACRSAVAGHDPPGGSVAGYPHDGRMVDALALAAEEGRGHAAKCPGEALAAGDPGMSEWGNPPGARPGTWSAISKRAPGELKHLSTPRNREDSLSSGERTGRSPNPCGGIACRRCQEGVGRVGWRGRQPPRSAGTFEPKTAGTGHRRG
jgi:hypothetical protein